MEKNGKGNNGGFEISWGIQRYGMGQLTFIKNKDGTVTCDNEIMSEEFCRIVLEQFLKKTIFRHDVSDHANPK